MQIKTVYSYELVLNKKIEAQAMITDEGIVVNVAGGDHSHIGSVSIVDSNGKLESKRFEGHMDYAVGDKWALRLYEVLMVPVVVSAGIHYDNITKENIQSVVNACDRILNDIIIKIEVI